MHLVNVPAHQLRVSTILLFGDVPLFAVIGVSAMCEGDTRGGPYFTMSLDDNETRCDRLGRQESIQSIFHNVNGQLGGCICSGLPI